MLVSKRCYGTPEANFKQEDSKTVVVEFVAETGISWGIPRVSIFGRSVVETVRIRIPDLSVWTTMLKADEVRPANCCGRRRACNVRKKTARWRAVYSCAAIRDLMSATLEY